jgi:hypothetical protein
MSVTLTDEEAELLRRLVRAYGCCPASRDVPTIEALQAKLP